MGSLSLILLFCGVWNPVGGAWLSLPSGLYSSVWVALPGCKECQVFPSCLSTSYLTVLPHCFRRRLRPKPSILCRDPHLPAMPGGDLKSLHHAASTLPGQLGSVGVNRALNLTSLPAWILSAHMRSLLSHASLLSFTRSLCGTHTAATRHCQAFMHPTSPKGNKSFLVRAGCSLLLPSTVLGDRISLLDFPSWCCSRGCTAYCVHTAWVTQTLCILPSLSQLGLGVSCRRWGPLLQEGQESLSCIFSPLFSPLLQAPHTEYLPFNL